MTRPSIRNAGVTLRPGDGHHRATATTLPSSAADGDAHRLDRITEHLEFAVPLRVAELAHVPVDDLTRLAAEQAEVVASHGDALAFAPSSDAGRACLRALVTGLACGALVAADGITFNGIHFGGRPDPTKRAAIDLRRTA